MQIDINEIYLNGRFDERHMWEILIKNKKEELRENINWINYNENMYAIKVLDDLLKGEE